MKSTSFALAATLLLGATPLLAVQQTGACSATAPQIAVSSVALAPAGTQCPVETMCFNVAWTATPNGQTLTGFRVDLKAVAGGKSFNGTAQNISGSARSAVVNIFMNGALQTYDAKVTATYSGCAAASKAGSF